MGRNFLRLSPSSRGQSAIEFSITLIVFLVIFFAMGDFLKITYNWLGIQYATHRGARVVKGMPAEIAVQEKTNLIKQEVVRAANALGISLEGSSGVTVVDLNPRSLLVETNKQVTLTPLSGLLLDFGGDNSGTYDIRVREVIHNGEL